MKKRGQIWVETIIYTLIAFLLIAAVIFFVKPKIEEIQDKAMIEQSIEFIKSIDSTINEIGQEPAGNKRILELGIKKGSFKFDGGNDTIAFEIETSYKYSEPEVDVAEGNLIVLTKEKSGFNLISITRNYTQYNLTYKMEDKLKILTEAPTSYKLSLSNKGGALIIIDAEIN